MERLDAGPPASEYEAGSVSTAPGTVTCGLRPPGLCPTCLIRGREEKDWRVPELLPEAAVKALASGCPEAPDLAELDRGWVEEAECWLSS